MNQNPKRNKKYISFLKTPSPPLSLSSFFSFILTIHIHSMFSPTLPPSMIHRGHGQRTTAMAVFQKCIAKSTTTISLADELPRVAGTKRAERAPARTNVAKKSRVVEMPLPAWDVSHTVSPSTWYPGAPVFTPRVFAPTVVYPDSTSVAMEMQACPLPSAPVLMPVYPPPSLPATLDGSLYASSTRMADVMHVVHMIKNTHPTDIRDTAVSKSVKMWSSLTTPSTTRSDLMTELELLMVNLEIGQVVSNTLFTTTDPFALSCHVSIVDVRRAPNAGMELAQDFGDTLWTLVDVLMGAFICCDAIERSVFAKKKDRVTTVVGPFAALNVFGGAVQTAMRDLFAMNTDGFALVARNPRLAARMVRDLVEYSRTRVTAIHATLLESHGSHVEEVGDESV